MSNPFSAIEKALIDAGKFITGVAANVATLFAKEKALAPAVAECIVTLVGDVESLIALSTSVASAEGLNFPADSAAYTQFLKVKSDVIATAAELQKAVDVLK